MSEPHPGGVDRHGAGEPANSGLSDLGGQRISSHCGCEFFPGPNRRGASRHGSVAVAFHWLTAVLALAAFLVGPRASGQRVYSAAKDFARQIHEVLGLMVFSLTLLRLVSRAFAPAAQSPSAPRWMKRISKVVRGLLYTLLVATPVTAIAGAWLEGHPLTLGILGDVPPMIPEAHPAGQAIAQIHTILGDAVVWLAGEESRIVYIHRLRRAVVRAEK